MLVLDEQVGEVVVGAVQLGVAVLELLVDRGQLLVGRLQLLLGGLQLLVGALQLLVAGEDLLVGAPQLFVGRVLLLDHRLQVFPGRGQLLPELGELAARSRSPRPAPASAATAEGTAARGPSRRAPGDGPGRHAGRTGITSMPTSDDPSGERTRIPSRRTAWRPAFASMSALRSSRKSPSRAILSRLMVGSPEGASSQGLVRPGTAGCRSSRPPAHPAARSGRAGAGRPPSGSPAASEPAALLAARASSRARCSRVGTKYCCRIGVGRRR